MTDFKRQMAQMEPGHWTCGYWSFSELSNDGHIDIYYADHHLGTAISHAGAVKWCKANWREVELDWASEKTPVRRCRDSAEFYVSRAKKKS